MCVFPVPWIFVLPCAAVGPFISQPLPAESVAGPGYGPLVLIPAQMIDSPEGETTGLALWLAVNVLRVTLCHQGRKKWGRKAMKVTGERAMVATGSGKKNQRNVGHPAKKLYINFWKERPLNYQSICEKQMTVMPLLWKQEFLNYF